MENPRFVVRISYVSQYIYGLVYGDYLEISLSPLPILNKNGNRIGRVGDTSLVFDGNAFLVEKEKEKDVVDPGDYYVNYLSGKILVRSGANERIVQASWRTKTTEICDTTVTQEPIYGCIS